jgi:hypothetical protein
MTLPVMAVPDLIRGSGPAIHAFNLQKDVDARHKAGHDEERGSSSRSFRPDGAQRNPPASATQALKS